MCSNAEIGMKVAWAFNRQLQNCAPAVGRDSDRAEQRERRTMTTEAATDEAVTNSSRHQDTATTKLQTGTRDNHEEQTNMTVGTIA